MNTNEPLVSIIIPVYNAAEYLPELFESVLKQSYTNIELICVDDGSTDQSYAVLSGFAQQDERIKAFQRKNSGASETRNFGIQQASGEYICFVDSDDFIEQDAIEVLVTTALQQDVDVVLFDLNNYDENLDAFAPNNSINREYVPVRQVFQLKDVQNAYKHIIGFTVNKFYRADLLRKNKLQFPKVNAHEDMPFTYLALSLAKEIYYLDRVLYHYRRSNLGSLSNTVEKNYKYMFEALELTRNGLNEYGIFPEYEKNFNSYVLHMCTWQYSRKDPLAKIEFLDTTKKIWFPKLGCEYLTAENVFDQGDYEIYKKVNTLTARKKIFARIYLRLREITLLRKAVRFARRLRGRLVAFIKNRQIVQRLLRNRNK